MTNFIPQFNMSFFQGFSVGFVLCLILLFFYGYLINRKQTSDKQHLEEELAKAKVANESSEQARLLLLQIQQESQDLLEEKVQERTIELNIALQELEEANQELEQKNTLDELTGLFNRRFYDQKIVAEYRRSKRNLTPLSLVLIDIDHFKSVNDTYGHLAGDQCLMWLSEHIKSSLKRSTDTAFRYGGEEFCLILPDTDSQGAIALAEALRERVAKHPCLYKETEISITISNGISTYTQQADVQPEQLFLGADKALYQSKDAGRNQTQSYHFTEE